MTAAALRFFGVAEFLGRRSSRKRPTCLRLTLMRQTTENVRTRLIVARRRLLAFLFPN